METPRAKPLFVIGTARSGTTWLANMLVSHPDLAGVTAAEHQGIHESHLCSHTRYVLKGRRSCREFVELYRREDYFKLLRLGPRELCEGEGRMDVYLFFRLLMEKYAASQGAKYWLEKTPKHAIYYQEILENFPDAAFVVIERNFEKTLLSNLNKFARPGASRWRQVFEKVFRYVSDMRAMVRLKERAPGQVVTVLYEDLVKNTDQEMSRILAFLELPPMPLRSSFPADSSFRDGASNQFVFSRFGGLVIRGMKFLLSLVPWRLMYLARSQRDQAEARIFPKFELFKDSEISDR